MMFSRNWATAPRSTFSALCSGWPSFISNSTLSVALHFWTIWRSPYIPAAVS